MKIGTKNRRTNFAYLALSLIAVAGGTCAADEKTRAEIQATNTTSNAQQCTGREVLTGPDGHEFRQAYVPGFGCKYVVDGDSVVFTVGPNGYAFAWTQESGWKLLKTAN